MALARDHELHRRRASRNIGVGVTLVAFIVLIFGLTIAKVQNGGQIEGYDHSFRPGLAEQAQ
jgi:hypothetical protein